MGFNETVPFGIQSACYNASKSPMMYGIGILFMIICLVAVGLRFWARKVANVAYGLDDWLVLATLPFIITVTAMNLSTTLKSGQYPIGTPNTNNTLMNEWAVRVLVGMFFFNAAIAMFKLSFLALYVRLFGVCSTLRRRCIAVGTIIITWLIVVEMILIFRCNPISGHWAPRGSICVVTFHTYNIMTTVPNVVFGFLTLIIPIRLVWKMRLDLISRIAVSGVFVLGGFDLVISICRMVFALHPYGASGTKWSSLAMYYWSAAEPAAGILSCCLLTYAPLFRAFRTHKRRGSEKYLKPISHETLPENITYQKAIASTEMTSTAPITLSTLPPAHSPV